MQEKIFFPNEEYGMSRTGCCGCPCALNFESELEILKTYEPKLYKAVTNVFKDSYEYTRKYREFAQKQRALKKEEKKKSKLLKAEYIQMSIFDFLF